MSAPKVVIVGAGFGGLAAARALSGVPVQITVIDRNNHHLFQPLLYQVATAGLSPADIAVPIRSVLRRNPRIQVLMAEVTGVDLEARAVQMGDQTENFDFLVLATGASHSYFGKDQWEKVAPGLKRIEDATRIRRRILLAFEQAEMEKNEERRKALLTFVVVGGGPTGVELAGSIGELAHQALKRDFRKVDPHSARIVLIEAGPRILASFPEKLAEKATRKLERLGVEIRVGLRVEDINSEGALIGGERLPSRTVLWAAGVVASPAGKWLGVETDRAGRVKILKDLTIPGRPNIFVIGDTAFLEQKGKPLPGVAPVALQQGRYVASVIRDRLAERGIAKPFHYRDKGNLATVGRSFAIVDLGFTRLSGWIAWLAWVVVHIYYLIGFRNRLVVLLEWAWAYVTFQRGARLITRESQ